MSAGVVNVFSKKQVDAKEFHPFHMTKKTNANKHTGLSVKEFKKIIREGNWRF